MTQGSKSDRKRNRSKVSPTVAGKQAKPKLDISSSGTSTIDACLAISENIMASSLSDISTRIAEQGIKLKDRDTNLIKVIVALIEESLTNSTNFINQSLQEEISAHTQTKNELADLQSKHDNLEYECKKL